MTDRRAQPPANCPDCGPASVPHWVERLSTRLDAIFAYAIKPPQLVWRGIKPGVARLRMGRMMPQAASAFASIGLGTVIVKPDEKINWRARVLWEEAARRGITMKEFRPFGLAREIFFASYEGDTIAFDGLPRPRTARETSLSWMDDKGVIIKKFREVGIPVPHGRTCTTLRQAEAAFKAIGGTVVVKPNLGSRSRHTYIGIASLAALRHAFEKAKELSPYVVVEEEFKGFVFRVTLVDGKIAGVMRREPPHVVGDGEHTVRELIHAENKNPLRHGPIFHELPLNHDAPLSSVPEKGKMVVLHEKVSRAYGASTTEITDIHPDNRALFHAIARILDDPLVGVDFMIEDMASSWREQRCGIIECNSLPFIDLHHFPLRGPSRNAAGAVWDMIFPASRR